MKDAEAGAEKQITEPHKSDIINECEPSDTSCAWGGNNMRILLILLVGIVGRVTVAMSNASLGRKQDFVPSIHAVQNLRECIYLRKHELLGSGRSGCRQNVFFGFLKLVDKFPEEQTGDIFLLILFILLDVFGAILVRNVVEVYSDRVRKSRPGGVNKIENSLLAFAIIFLHPYAILACGSLSTGSVSRLTVLLSLKHCIKKEYIFATASLTFSLYCDSAMMIILFPMIVCLSTDSAGTHYGENTRWKVQIKKNIIDMRVFSCCCLSVFVLFVASNYVLALYLSEDMLAWDEILWRFNFNENCPNPGLSWYFFAEVFNRFRQYFVFMFNAFPGSIVLPLSIRFIDCPITGLTSLLIISSMVTPYTNFSDLVLPTALYPVCNICSKNTILNFITISGLSATSTMIFVMKRKWLVYGTGNANYLYNQNLAFCMLHFVYLSSTVFSRRQK